jgi:hypothetical protein
MMSAAAVALAGLVVFQSWQSEQHARATNLDAVTVTGRVVNDIEGRGTKFSADDPNAPGVQGVEVELWREHQDQDPTRLGAVTTAADGGYRFDLTEYPGSYLVRVRPSRIDGVNARQTAFAGKASADSGVVGFCWSEGSGDYTPTEAGPCFGARRDGVDPPVVAAPVRVEPGSGIDDAVYTGEANTVARIVAGSSGAPVQASFALTTAGSWGDLPDVYRTTAGAGGPYALGQALGPDGQERGAVLQLGGTADLSADGRPSDRALSSPNTDDGIRFAIPATGHYPDEDWEDWEDLLNESYWLETPDPDAQWYSAGDAVFLRNGVYGIRAEIRADCDWLPKATVKVWITAPDEQGQVPTKLPAEPLWQVTPNLRCTAAELRADEPVTRFVYYFFEDQELGLDDWTVELTDLYVRARIGADPGFTAISPGSPGDPYTEPWVMPGEIEDYRIHQAGAVVYFTNQAIGSTDAVFVNEYTNIRDDLDFELPFAGGVVADLSQPVTARLVAAGPPGATTLNGWRMFDDGRTCLRDTGFLASDEYGEYSVEDDSLTVAGPFSRYRHGIVLCHLNYAAALDQDLSQVTVSPVPDSATPLAVGYSNYDVAAGAYAFDVAGAGLVTGGDGSLTQLPAAGTKLRVTVEPLDGGATADGAMAHWKTPQDDWYTESDQDLEFALDRDGRGRVEVSGSTPGTYQVTIRTMDTPATVLATQEVYFGSARAVGGGQFSIDTSEPKYANYGLLPGAPGFDGTWDYYVAQIEVWGSDLVPVTGLERGGLSPYYGCGTSFGPVTPVSGEPGHYEFKMYSNSADQARPNQCNLSINGVPLTVSGTDDEHTVYLDWRSVPVADPAKSRFLVWRSGVVAGWIDEDNPGDSVDVYLDARDAQGVEVRLDGQSISDGHWAELEGTLWAWSEDNSPALHFGCYGDFWWAEGCAWGLYASAPGVYRPKIIINPGTAWETSLIASEPVVFTSPEPPAPAKSSAIASRTPGQLADWDYSPPGAIFAKEPGWGRQTVTIRLRDAQGVAELKPETIGLEILPAVDAGSGLELGDQPDPWGGQGLSWSHAICAADGLPAGWGACFGGVYTVDVYSAYAGERRVVVRASSELSELAADGQEVLVPYEFLVDNGENRATKILSLPFVAPTTPSVADSALAVTPASVDGDAVPVVAGQAYTATASVFSAGGNNPVVDAQVRFTLSGDGCTAAFANGQKQYHVGSSAIGRAVAVVDAADPGACELRALVGSASGAEELSGSPKTLTWTAVGAAPVLDLIESSFTVSGASVYADGAATGTVTANLVGTDGQPWTGAVALSGTGAPGSNLSVGDFEVLRDGELTASFTGIEVGTWAVTVTADGTGLAPSGNAVATLRAGPAAMGAELTRVVAPYPASIDDPAGSTLVVHMVDARGRPMPDVTVAFALPAGLSAGAAAGPTVVWALADSAGVARLAVFADWPDVFEVGVSYDDVPVYGSPAEVEFFDPALADLTAVLSNQDGPIASHSQVVMSVAMNREFKIYVTDSTGVPMPDVPVHFHMTGGVCTGAIQGGDEPYQWSKTVRTDGDGYNRDPGWAGVTIGAGAVGSCLLSVDVPGANQVVGTPVTLKFVERDATRIDYEASSFEVSRTPVLVGGQGTVTVRLVNLLGDPFPNDFIDFEYPRSTGGASGGVSVGPFVYEYEGTYRAQFTGEQVGDWDIRVETSDNLWNWHQVSPVFDGLDIAHVVSEAPGAPTFTVSFDSAGGPDVADVVVDQGSAVVELPSVSRDGFRCVGWFTLAEGGIEAVAPFTPAADVTLFARWAPLPAFGAGLTRLVAPDAPGVAGEPDGVTVSAVVVDQDGSPLAGETVSFHVPAGLSAGTVAGPAVVRATTGDYGVAELVVAAGAVGSYGVTADVLVSGALVPVTNGSPAAVMFAAAPDAGVALTAVARCAAGKNQLAVTAFNGSGAALDVEFVSDWGSKQFTGIQPGKNAFHAFTVRSKNVASGTVQVTVSTTAADPVTVTRPVPYLENNC